MVDTGTLVSDVLQTSASLLLPALLWLFLYRFTWEQAATARDVGFTRSVFWLLLLGGVVSTVANLPLLGYAGNVLVVNLGGAVFPVLVGILLLNRTFSDQGRSTLRYLVVFTIASGLAFAELLFLRSGWILAAALGVTMVAVVLVFLLLSTRPAQSRLTPAPSPEIRSPGTSAGSTIRRLWRAFVNRLPSLASVRNALAAWKAGTLSDTVQAGVRVALALALTLLTLLVTFFTTATVPGLGITSTFPFYLIAPVGVGILAVYLAGPVAHLPARFGLPIAYAAATFGVLIGADLLRQPPLYATPGSIYSIGGAGPLDLVALSGPLAVLAAYATYWFRKIPETIPEKAPVRPEPAPTPAHELNRAFDLFARGSPVDSLRAAASSARHAGEVGRELLDLPAAADPGQSWDGLPVPAWVVGDQQNLESLAATASPGPGEAYRGIQTARLLVRLAGSLGNPRYGTSMRRALAFAIDLGLVSAFGATVWLILLFLIGPAMLTASLAFNTAVLGFASVAFFYLVLSEWRFGSTLGKNFFQLRVRDRGLAPASFLALLVRNVPKLVPLTILAYGGAIGIAFLLGAASLSTAAGGLPVANIVNVLTGVTLLIGTVVGIGLCGVVSVLAITWTSERQRLGDFLAGTWVVTVGPPSGVPAPAPGALGAVRSA